MESSCFQVEAVGLQNLKVVLSRLGKVVVVSLFSFSEHVFFSLKVRLRFE